MTDKELAHKINEEILASVEKSLIEAERDWVTVRNRTPDWESWIRGELQRLRPLRTEYLEKARVSGEELRAERDAQFAKAKAEAAAEIDKVFARVGDVKSPKIAIREG